MRVKAHKFVTDLEELHAELCKQMEKAQAYYQVDCWQEPAPDFHIGQQVYVSAEHICTTCPYKNLSETFLGPYKIIAQPGTHSLPYGFPTISVWYILFFMFPS